MRPGRCAGMKGVLPGAVSHHLKNVGPAMRESIVEQPPGYPGSFFNACGKSDRSITK